MRIAPGASILAQETSGLIFVLAVAISAEEEHFLDVKQIVKGTIEAVAKLPIPQQNTSAEGEKNPEDFYRLFQLPADIMTKLAEDAGYIDPRTTTSGMHLCAEYYVQRTFLCCIDHPSLYELIV
ncbi:hypothetical protein COOONC_23452 [Cooperia oncophora]